MITRPFRAFHPGPSPGRWGLLAAALIFLTGGCDIDRYLGSEYDAEAVASIIDIRGQVSNVFDGRPVEAAELFMAGQYAVTDSMGRYLLPFVRGFDEEFNRPIDVRILAEDYFPFDTTIFVLPAGNVLSPRLVYGAPIVESSARSFVTGDHRTRVRATVMDYQGVDNLAVVEAIGIYYDADNKMTLEVPFPMIRIQQLDERRAVYEAWLDPMVENRGPAGEAMAALLGDRHAIAARDRDGFDERVYYVD